MSYFQKHASRHPEQENPRASQVNKSKRSPFNKQQQQGLPKRQSEQNKQVKGVPKR
jgi:hypothetical protein